MKISIRNAACSCWECRNREYDFQRCYDYTELADRQEDFFKYWSALIGETIVLGRSSSVSPNDIRDGVSRTHYFAEADLDGVPGNTNRDIRRTEGWRGTTDDICVDALGIFLVKTVTQGKRKTVVELIKQTIE